MITISEEPYTLEEFKAQIEKYSIVPCVDCNDLLKKAEENTEEIINRKCQFCAFFYVFILEAKENEE